MREFIYTLVAVLYSLTASAEPSVEQVFKDACRLTQYDCTGIEIPAKRDSEMLISRNLAGAYFGGTVVWLNPLLGPQWETITTFHEMVHYLQRNTAGLRAGDQTSVCIVEYEAYSLSIKYQQELGYNLYEADLEGWRKRYGC